jgi:hypothetical protein
VRGAELTILCKIKSHRSEPLNETVDDLTDLGHKIDQEHAVWTIRSNRMVFSWMDGQKCSGVESTAERSGSGNI